MLAIYKQRLVNDVIMMVQHYSPDPKSFFLSSASLWESFIVVMHTFRNIIEIIMINVTQYSAVPVTSSPTMLRFKGIYFLWGCVPTEHRNSFFHSLTSHISAVGRRWDTVVCRDFCICVERARGDPQLQPSKQRVFSALPQPTPLLVSNVSTYFPTHITSVFIHKSWTLLLSLPHSQELCVFPLFAFKYLLGATLIRTKSHHADFVIDTDSQMIYNGTPTYLTHL